MITTSLQHDNESIYIIDTGPPTKKTKVPARTPRKARVAQHEDIPWTAARCQRLLRTISSRIQILRRLSENDFAEQFLRTPKAKRKRAISADPVQNLGTRLAALQTPSRGDDPDWFPTAEKKEIAKTYGGRARLKKQHSASNVQDGKGDSRFRTPYIKSLLRPEAMLSPVSPADDPYSTCNRLGQACRKGKQDAIQPKTHAERALKTLMDSFDSLLGATDPAVPEPRRGAPSMRRMCLRRVPAYIQYEQRWAEEEEDDYVFDATETMYLQLENLGQGSCSNLRELVRAHAVMLITDAMQERMWPLKSLDVLMEICVRHHAITESQQLLWTWLDSSHGKIEEPLKKFIGHAESIGSPGFMFRCLAQLTTPPGTDFPQLVLDKDIWKAIPTSLARRSYHADTAAFLRRFAWECQRMRCSTASSPGNPDRVHLMLEDILHLLTSMAILNGLSNETRDAHNSFADGIHRLALHIASDFSYSTGWHLEGGLTPEILNNFLAGSLMTHVAVGRFSSDECQVGFDALVDMLCEVDARVAQISSKHKQTASSVRAAFVINVARLMDCAEVGVLRASIIKQTAKGLLQSAERLCTAKALPLRLLASEIATSWAESQLDDDSQDFAEQIQRIAVVESSDDVAQSADGQYQPNGFYWEAAIGEWVASTPHVQSATLPCPKESSVISQDSGIGMSEAETPSKAPNVPVPRVSETELQPEAPGIDTSGAVFKPSKQPLREMKKENKVARGHSAYSPGRDELSLSSHKVKISKPIIAIFNDPESGSPENVEGIVPVLARPNKSTTPGDYQERDELANTPRFSRQPLTPVRSKTGASRMKTKRSKSSVVNATSSRMILRSHKKPRAEDKENDNERFDDDELAS